MGASKMPDWIDDVKRKKDAESNERVEEQAACQHASQIIESKVPMFWKTVTERVQADCQVLREKLPQYRPWTTTLPRGFTLHGGGHLPWKVLNLELNSSTQQIEVSEGIKQSREHQPFPEAKPPIEITLGANEELRVRFNGQTYNSPEALSEALIKYTCGIRS
jgi:hypothetical protein